MPVASLTLVERIARILAGRNISRNAKGDDPSAGPDVDESWPYYVEDARAILHTMREPDQAMAAAGDIATWQAMIDAALAAEEDEDDA